MWLLWHLEELQNATYPASLTSSPDWLPITVKDSKSGAYFETPMGILAELTFRLKRTRKDGKILLAQIASMRDDTPDAFYQRYETLDEDAKLALGYVGGRWRKKVPYYKWRWRKQHKGG